MPAKSPVAVKVWLAESEIAPLADVMLEPLVRAMFCDAVSETLPEPLVVRSELPVLSEIVPPVALRLPPLARVTGPVNVISPALNLALLEIVLGLEASIERLRIELAIVASETAPLKL